MTELDKILNTHFKGKVYEFETKYEYKDIKDMKFKCPDESEYNIPDKYVDSKGNRLYAYVTLVMLGDSYVPAAVVLAHSIRILNSHVDLVVLVTPDVSQSGRRCLGMYYDKVVEVDYVKINNWRTKKQPHRQYLDRVFTRFHALNLTQYKKVLLMDADAIILKHPDHLFTLDAPAGCLLYDKELFVSYDKEGNYVLPDNKKIEWYDKMCECCGHKQKIPKKYTDEVKTNRSSSGIGGGLLLLEPKEGELESIIRDIEGPMWKPVNRFFVWPEQQYITQRYSGQWTGINPRFFGLQGYPHWRVLFGLQYGGDKPFKISSKCKLEDRLDFPDFILWHTYLTDILNNKPALIDEKAMEESVEVNRLFKSRIKTHQLSRVGDIQYKIENIRNLFNLNEVNSIHTMYYHTDKNKNYLPKDTTTIMFNGVQEYDYLAPVHKLKKHYSNAKTDYYKQLLNRVESKNKKVPLNSYKLDSWDADEIILQYVKCRPKCFIITVWPEAVPVLNDIVKFMNVHGNVYYYKTLQLSYNGLKNLAFNMYDEFNKKDRVNFIKKKLDYIGADKNRSNSVGVIVFDNINDKKIGGQNSVFKRVVRDFVLGIIKKKGLRGNDVVHINDYFYQTTEYSQMLFNQNSINYLNKKDLDRFIKSSFDISTMKINTLKKWMYSSMQPVDMIRMCIMSGGILYSHGIRPLNDIDGLIIGLHKDNDDEKCLHNVVYNDFVKRETRFTFTDIDIEESKSWKQGWTDQNKKFMKHINVKSFGEIVLNPKHHYYDNGMKYYLINYEVVKKFLKLRPGDYVDLAIMYLKFKHIVENSITTDENNKIVYPNYSDKYRYNDVVEGYSVAVLKRKYFDITDITIDIVRDMFSNVE